MRNNALLFLSVRGIWHQHAALSSYKLNSRMAAGMWSALQACSC